MFQPGEPRFHDREQAREYRLKEIARPDPIFSTYPPEWIKDFHRQAMRWIDCAPEGANHLLAPLQGKDGRPCNAFENGENLGPNKAVRKIRAERGLNPFGHDFVRPRPCDDSDPLD